MTAPTAHGRRFLSAKDCALLSPIRAGVVIKWAKTRVTFYVPLCKKWPQMCTHLWPFKRRLFTYFVGNFSPFFLKIGESNVRKSETNNVAFFHVLREKQGKCRGNVGETQGKSKGNVLIFESCLNAWRTSASAFLKFLTIFCQRGFLPPFNGKWSGISFFFFSVRQTLRDKKNEWATLRRGHSFHLSR